MLVKCLVLRVEGAHLNSEFVSVLLRLCVPVDVYNTGARQNERECGEELGGVGGIVWVDL